MDVSPLQKQKKRKPYSCCGGDPNCWLNKTEKRIDDLFELAKSDLEGAKETLFMYMESVEMDRDWAKAKLTEATNIILSRPRKS